VHYPDQPQSSSRFADPHDLLVAAQILGARFVYGLTGNTIPLEWEAAAEAFAAAIRPLADEATQFGLPVMIESTSGPMTSDVSFVHNFRDAVDLAEIADIGVCLDLNHCWTERGLQETINRAGKRLQHVQVSDMVLGRRDRFRAVPGDGVIPLHRILGWVLDTGYTGLFDLEISPGADKPGVDTLSLAIERAEALLFELGL
jgi:sugar phosphate isomerase/epimerase